MTRKERRLARRFLDQFKTLSVEDTCTLAAIALHWYVAKLREEKRQ